MAGGLAVFWASSIKLNVAIKSKNFFSCKITDVIETNVVYEWTLILLYGSPYLGDRPKVWETITSICSNSRDDFVILGDINQVEYSHQKMGGHKLIQGRNDFIKCRNEWQVTDIPFHGPKFTWCNNRVGNERIYEQLDRGYASDSWLEAFPEATILNFPIVVSDHGPIILHTKPDNKRKKGPIRMEAWCLDMEEPKKIIKEAWQKNDGGSPMFGCSKKLKNTRYELFKWSRDFKMANNLIWEKVMEDCDMAQAKLGEGGNAAREGNVREECLQHAILKLAFWKQRAKGKWNALGDSNTKYFFRSAKARKKKNEILLLKGPDGKWETTPGKIQEVILNHFKEILMRKGDGGTSREGLNAELESIVDIIPKINDNHKNILAAAVNMGEIKKAIFQLGPLKAPGPDGIPACFYQKAWEIVGEDVTKAVQHFFSNGYMLKQWNQTFIALIPKVERPENPGQLRPISLCNVIYKIISKCLTNRMKVIMPEIVGPYQNAFVSGRLMGDNCLLSHEVLNFTKKRKKGRDFYAVLKIDMNKAYDRVNWDFISWLLEHMGFPHIWVHWIKQCISTVSYSILINGEPSPSFQPCCGLRQGDPMSPYIFILVMEVLSNMMLKLQSKGEITGIRVARGAPSISHLFFADDALFCFKATPEACTTIRNTIRLFFDISREMINYEKSSVMFSPNTPTKFKHMMRKILGTPSTNKLGTYLGCNVKVDGRSSHLFQPLIDKVQKKINSWKNLALSQAGRLLLINGILAALCSNILSVFLAPKIIKKRIDSMLCRFWWKGSSDTKGICWRKRTLLGKPKEIGGVGLRSVELFNKALLVKHAHRIHNNNQL